MATTATVTALKRTRTQIRPLPLRPAARGCRAGTRSGTLEYQHQPWWPKHLLRLDGAALVIARFCRRGGRTTFDAVGYTPCNPKCVSSCILIAQLLFFRPGLQASKHELVMFQPNPESSLSRYIACLSHYDVGRFFQVHDSYMPDGSERLY